MSLKITTAKISDLPTLKKFEQGIIFAERPYDTTLKPDPISYYDLESFILDPAIEVAVGWIDEQIVCSGYCKILKGEEYRSFSKLGYIGFLYTLPAFRRKGYNKHLVDYLSHWAQEKGVSEFQLEVYPDNISAVLAYEKSGFKPHLLRMRKAL